MFGFHFPFHSFSTPFEDSFWRICKRRLPIHKANIFTMGSSNHTADKFRQHCKFQQFLIWQWHPALQTPPQAPPPLLNTGSALRPSVVFLLSTLYCSPLTETSFLTHLSDFRPTLSCFFLCSYVLQMASRNINRYFLRNLQILWKTYQL